MNRTNLKWENPAEGWKLDFTWNPVYGCHRRCYYCYARKIHDGYHKRFNKGTENFKQFAVPFETIQFFDNRLEQPLQYQTQKTIFCGDMADICFQHPNNIKKLIEVMRRCEWHRFLLLTKDYGFYTKYEWPLNVWLGITMEFAQLHKNPQFKLFKQLHHPRKFISIEPIMGMFDGFDLSFVQWVIVGKMNEKYTDKPIVPEERWVKSISHPNIYFKDFTTKALRIKA